MSLTRDVLEAADRAGKTLGLIAVWLVVAGLAGRTAVVVDTGNMVASRTIG